jgi:hypothetical protein
MTGGAIMPTIDDIVMSIEIEREQAVKRRDRAAAEIRSILTKVRADGRTNLTDDEDRDTDQAEANRTRARQEIEGIDVKLGKAKRAQAAEQQIEAAGEERGIFNPETTVTPRPAYDRVARVGQEERTYHQGNTGKGSGFLKDVINAYAHRDLEAEGRLSRHMQEERVERSGQLTRAAGDAGTGAFAGLVVPQYLTEMYAPKVAAMRPFADIMNKHDLPADGMTVNISQITTGSSVDLQAAEFDQVAGVSMDDTLLTENVQTAAGFQDLSRQAIDRGTGIEDVTVDDLFRRYASRIDFTILNQAVTGLSAVAQSTAATVVSFVGVWPKLSAAMAQAEGVFLGYATPDVVVMHPRRWHWLNNMLVSTWPAMAQPGIPAQQSGVNAAEKYGRGFRGYLPNGLAVVVDANIGTAFGGGTEDEIYVVASDEAHLWEDPGAPTFIRAEQPRAKNMAVTLVLYGYFAYSMRRYTNGMQKINGAALVTPTFTGS